MFIYFNVLISPKSVEKQYKKCKTQGTVMCYFQDFSMIIVKEMAKRSIEIC